MRISVATRQLIWAEAVGAREPRRDGGRVVVVGSAPRRGGVPLPRKRTAPRPIAQSTVREAQDIHQNYAVKPAGRVVLRL